MTDVYLPNINVEFTNEKGLLTESAYRFLYNLWLRTGGSDDMVSAVDNNIYYWTTRSFETDYRLVSTAIDYTTQGNMIIIATSPITITLNPNPKDEEKVIIKRATSLAPVNINASAIDGATTYQLIVNYEAVQCIYSITDASWFII
jgi:hypothetical protein